MLTKLEIKRLNFIFKKLKGEHKEYYELFKFLKNNLGLPENVAFEFAYLYDINFVEDGDFSSVTDPERMAFEEYQEKVPIEIKLVMKITGDEDFENYDFDGGNEVEHDGTIYQIFEGDSEIYDRALSSDFSWMCEDIGEHNRSYIYMTEYSRSEFAEEEAESQVDNMDVEDIISGGGYRDEMEELESLEDELKDLKSDIESKTEEMEELVDQLEDITDDEEKNRLVEEIADLEIEIADLEKRVEEIGDIDEKKESLIKSAKEKLIEEIESDIYDELDDPYGYFVETNGIYRNANSLVSRGPGHFDCDRYLEDTVSDYIYNSDFESVVNYAGFSNYEEIRYDDTTYYVLWD